jgi:hypothetical protein
MVSLREKRLLDNRLEREASRLVDSAGSPQLRPIQILHRLTEFRNGLPVPKTLDDVEKPTIDCLLGLEFIRRTVGGYELNFRFGEFLEDRLLLWDSATDDDNAEQEYMDLGLPIQEEFQATLQR